MRWTLIQSLQATLLYSLMFDYPLTKEEVSKYFISSSPQHIRKIEQMLKPYQIGKSEYYSLTKDKKLLARRKKREEESKKKWKILSETLPFLTWVPTIQLIGVSGSLAMNNADEADDIDLFIVCLPGTIWISRFCVLVILELLGKRRTFGSVVQKNLLCPNMFLVSSNLAIPKKERDIYSAHEVVQLIPLFIVGDMYTKFLQANSWVSSMLPHAYTTIQQQDYQVHTLHIVRSFAATIYKLLNVPAKIVQLWFIRSHKTTEVVKDTILKFHPRDAQEKVRKKFTLLLQQKNIPLDSRFF